MAKFAPMDLLKSLSGKLCSHSDVYFANKNDAHYTGKICNPRTKPYTTAELARQTLFSSTITALAGLTSTEITAYTTAFANQRRYSTLRGYMFAQEYAKAKAAAQGGGGGQS